MVVVDAATSARTLSAASGAFWIGGGGGAGLGGAGAGAGRRGCGGIAAVGGGDPP